MRLPHPEEGFFKNLLTLAVPMMLQSLVSFLVGFADNLMVGTLGEIAISGVYLGNQPQTLLQNIIIGVDSAMLILSAQYWGRRDTDSIKKLFVIALRIALSLAVVFTAATIIAPRPILHLFIQDEVVIEEGMRYLSYVRWSYMIFAASQLLITSMRSVETVKVGMYSSFISLGVNVVLNYILIFGKLGAPKMGIAGAALATLISRIVEFAVAFTYVFFMDKKLQLKPKDLLHSNSTLLRDFIKYGAPVIAGWVVWGINGTVQGAIVGSLGASAASAVSILSMSRQMLNVALSATSGAVGIMTGKLVGAGEVERVKNHARVVQLMFLCIGIGGCIIINLIKGPFISLYTLTEETRILTRQIMTSFSFLFIGTCYQGHSLGSLVKAGGDTKFVFINDTIFVFGFVLPAAFITRYVLHLPAWVVYTVLISDELLKCPVAFVKINRFKWIKNLTRSKEELAK
ncbi:MAG: MATE family efflux transporter [Ruminococcaceae bacterium]|nr:MATE family efflux transporter [Oscillospiraceae bacterium]